MNDKFDPESYLEELKIKVKEFSDDLLKERLLECEERIAYYDAEYDSCIEDYNKWKEKYNRYKKGERKTYPYPRNGGIDWQYVREKHKTWHGYWSRKKTVLEKELNKRKARMVA